MPDAPKPVTLGDLFVHYQNGELKLRSGGYVADTRPATVADLVSALRAEGVLVVESQFIVPVKEGRNEEPYELGWCREHEDVARRYSDGSWGCWWESIVEASGNHSLADFGSLAEAQP